MTFAPAFSIGNFLPEQVNIPDDPIELKRYLKNTLEEYALTINRKDTAQYEEVELQSNQTYPGDTPQSKRQLYRKVVKGTLVTGANAIAHGIDTGGAGSTYVFTHVFGTAYNQTAPLWVPLPNDTALVTIDGTNINITAPVSLNGFDVQIVLEFYKA